MEEVENFGHEVAWQRPGQPEEPAPVSALLASQDSSFMNGSLVEVTPAAGRQNPVATAGVLRYHEAMKTTFHLLAAVMVFLGRTSAFSQEAGWTDDLAKATAQAKAENKAILLDFTGSDWCGWCMKMKKETLDTPEFVSYAQKNLVLVTVDFPHSTPLTPAVKQQNDKLDAKYQANGFPTYILVDKFGRELWRQTGYLAGGPTAFIAALSKSYRPAPVKAAGAGGGDDFDNFFKKAAPSPAP